MLINFLSRTAADNERLGTSNCALPDLTSALPAFDKTSPPNPPLLPPLAHPGGSSAESVGRGGAAQLASASYSSHLAAKIEISGEGGKLPPERYFQVAGDFQSALTVGRDGINPLTAPTPFGSGLPHFGG